MCRHLATEMKTGPITTPGCHRRTSRSTYPRGPREVDLSSPNEIAKERIKDQLRESDHEHLGRRPAEARAFVRRAKVRATLNVVVGTLAQARRKRVTRTA